MTTTITTSPGALRALCEHIKSADGADFFGNPEWVAILNEADAILNNRLGELWMERIDSALDGAGFGGLSEGQRDLFKVLTDSRSGPADIAELRGMLEDFRDRLGVSLADVALLSLGLKDEQEQGKPLPDTDELLRSNAVSFWFKAALNSALKRDPVDAANEAEILAQVLIRVAEGRAS